MQEDIRIFLESPRSLELVDEAPTVKTHKAQKRNRRERLPPRIPFHNIYAQTDLSKLTERQRILAMKFQANRSRASSLFLAVNDLYITARDTPRCKRCSLDAIDLLGFLEWLAARHSCPRHAKILNLKKRIESLMSKGSCICRKEKNLYIEATNAANYSCCMEEIFQ